MESRIKVEFANNPDPRVACLLLLDTSGSMEGSPIAELNAGLKAFEADLRSDELASRRVEVGIVTFGDSVQTIQAFATVDRFSAPTLRANGNTPMGAAIETGLSMVRARKDEYKANGVPYYQPWIFLITDGAPTDAWQPAAQQAQADISAKRLSLFAVGVEGADMNVLAQITPRALHLKGLAFRELFLWLSQSMSRVSGSRPTDQTPLAPVAFGSPV